MTRASVVNFTPGSLRSRDPRQRRELVNDAFVDRAQLKNIVQTMDLMRRDYRENAEAKCMVLVGEPGVGKSTFLTKYRDSSRVAEITTETGIRRPKPVIYVQLPSDATVNICSDEILSAVMGQKIHSNGRSKEGPLETQLRVNEVELIILDEFQHAAARGREKTQSQTADFVKSITKRSRIPVVMAGLSMARLREAAARIWDEDAVPASPEARWLAATGALRFSYYDPPGAGRRQHRWHAGDLVTEIQRRTGLVEIDAG